MSWNSQTPCPRCKSPHTGSSPTGWWCNACGDQNPCPCWNKQYCEAHDPKHVHEFDERGRCKGSCGADARFQPAVK